MKIRLKQRKTVLIVAAIILAIAALSFLIIKPMWFSKKPGTIRPAAFAGQFYPADKEELSAVIRGYLAGAETAGATGTPKVIIVPHAGYDYSGPVSAAAYKAIAGQEVRRVYIIANSHHRYFSGLETDGSDYWETPLGLVAVDQEKVRSLAAASPLIKINRAEEDADHVIEVQLPFLQTVLGTGFKIVSLMFGNTDEDSYQTLARVLVDNLEPGDIIIASSDMSHYPSDEVAERIDSETLRLIGQEDIAALVQHSQVSLKETGEETVLCGLEAVKTAIAIAKELGLQPQIRKYQNSGDTVFGDKKAVVGYGAVIFWDPASANQSTLEPISAADQAILKEIAQQAVETYIKKRGIINPKISSPRLNQSQGAFVTLRIGGELRGCLGEIAASGPLWQVVRDMAIAAATEDGRFTPVTEEELDSLEYEISALSRPEKIGDWRAIDLGQDGVIVRKGRKSGVFLPQVAAEIGWSREEFLRQLCSQKAGLPADCYQDPEVELEVFRAQAF